MSMDRETYSVQVAGLERDLPIFEVAPGVRIAVLNILGDTELVKASAAALLERLEELDYDVIVTPEAKSIPLAHVMGAQSGKPYVVLRKAFKVYMGDTVKAETVSITTGQPQTLYLDEKDRRLVAGRRILLVDDVVSTGSTLQGMEKVMRVADARVVARAAIFTEGDQEQWSDIVALGHLPIFMD